ncbi:MAG: PKD domain-containing protein [Methanomicrobium sp.]|nr:PKD domain-containing protein [Methanomicrobium sp.]
MKFIHYENNKNLKISKKTFTISTLILLLTAVLFISPAAAEPAFEWEIYIINTEDWEDTNEYLAYDGTIYEVHFFDKSSDSKSWSWEFGDDDWWGSTEKNPVHIFTEEEVLDGNYMIKVKLSIVDSSGSGDTVSNTLFFDPDDPWTPRNTIFELTPKPTSTPTPVPTTVAPTPVPTTTAPTAQPTQKASQSLEIPGISQELKKLQDTYQDLIVVIKSMFGIS